MALPEKPHLPFPSYTGRKDSGPAPQAGMPAKPRLVATPYGGRDERLAEDLQPQLGPGKIPPVFYNRPEGGPPAGKNADVDILKKA